jgi:ribose 1,5-bisphosphate isomerase
MNKKKEFEKILKDIKLIKIQGALNVAQAALKAYVLIPTSLSKKKLLKSRPTEPMMRYVLNLAEKKKYKEIFNHFNSTQGKINETVLKLIKNKEIILTHCHSTNVVNSLIYARKKRKFFEVYATETRPLFQGRKTAKELANAKIKVTMFVESFLDDAISGKQSMKKVKKIFIGADALLKGGIINKVGSELIAKIAKENKVPVYIIADSWKFSKNKVPLEQRNLNEIWDKAPKNVKIKNPAFEFVDKKYISGIVTELGFMKYDKFVKRMVK